MNGRALAFAIIVSVFQFSIWCLFTQNTENIMINIIFIVAAMLTGVMVCTDIAEQIKRTWDD